MGPSVEPIIRAARDLRRVGRITHWVGTAWSASESSPYPFRAVVFSTILHLGVMLPCSRIARLYGRAIESDATSS